MKMFSHSSHPGLIGLIDTKEMQLLVTAIALVLLAGCGLSSDPRQSTQRRTFNNITSVQAFEQTVYPVVRANCASCHGSSQSPLFATSSFSNSHDAALPYVDLGVPSNSTLARRSADLHCGSACGDNAEMIAAITQWADLAGGSSAQTGGGSLTALLSIPAGAETGFVELNWDLAVLDGALAGVSFSIEIEVFDGSTYRVRNPTLHTAGEDIYVEDVRIFINDQYDSQNSNYTSVSEVVPSNSSTVVAGSDMLMNQVLGRSQDQLSIGFAVIRQN